jgi:hypothetical protein
MKVIKSLVLEITSQELELDCHMNLSFRAGLWEQVVSKLKEIEELEVISD